MSHSQNTFFIVNGLTLLVNIVACRLPQSYLLFFNFSILYLFLFMFVNKTLRVLKNHQKLITHARASVGRKRARELVHTKIRAQVGSKRMREIEIDLELAIQEGPSMG